MSTCIKCEKDYPEEFKYCPGCSTKLKRQNVNKEEMLERILTQLLTRGLNWSNADIEMSFNLDRETFDNLYKTLYQLKKYIPKAIQEYEKEIKTQEVKKKETTNASI